MDYSVWCVAPREQDTEVSRGLTLEIAEALCEYMNDVEPYADYRVAPTE